MFTLYSNANGGVMCPVSMTYAAVPALRDGAPELAAEWEPRLTSTDYVRGALAGMAMTECHGGSDVRANITRAPVRRRHLRDPRTQVVLLISAARRLPGPRPGPQRPRVLLVERGAGMELQRVKDKLGTRSLPSAEVEFRGARGWLVGEEGRGVPTIIRMVNHTRLDCLLGSTAGARRGTLEAIHHARHRMAFGALLADQPAMRDVLADLAIESEAATAAALRLARAYDDPADGDFRRFATAVMKYWITKRSAAHAAEALECLGGNGSVEDSGLPLLYRDAPLNSIWEGSGNAAALDVLRAVVREPAGPPAFLAECELSAGTEPRLDAQHPRSRVLAAFGGGHGKSAEQRRYDNQFERARSSRTRRSPCRRPCWSATRRWRSPTLSALTT